ncbi:MAG: transposase [Anaerolineaceae bacterium]|nr:transposase [Anaerolineaceae bacterium]
MLYDYQKTRSGDHPIQFLKGFTGYLECDGFSGYRKMGRLVDEVSIACCWAHARRDFADAVKAYGEKAKVFRKLTHTGHWRKLPEFIFWMKNSRIFRPKNGRNGVRPR